MCRVREEVLRNTLQIPASRTDYSSFSFYPRTIADRNALPENAVSAPCLETFLVRI